MYVEKVGVAGFSKSSVMICHTTRCHIKTTIFIFTVVWTWDLIGYILFKIHDSCLYQRLRKVCLCDSVGYSIYCRRSSPAQIKQIILERSFFTCIIRLNLCSKAPSENYKRVLTTDSRAKFRNLFFLYRATCASQITCHSSHTAAT
jgi:hypothetical protein